MNSNNEGIQHGLSGDDLEKELAKAEQEDNVSTDKINPTEEAQAKLENTTESATNKVESVEKSFTEIGGQEGIDKVISNMSTQEKQEIEEKIKKFQKQLNESLAMSKLGFSIAFNPIKTFKDMREEFGTLGAIPATIMMQPTGSLIGGSMFGIAGMLKSISEKLKLNSEKRKLSKLERKAA